MVFTLYRWTNSSLVFNRLATFIVTHFEVPLLISIFKLAGATRVKARNSILDPGIYNVFMSDLDYSIVCETTQMRFIYSIATALKKVFINLGELEFYTAQEWEEIERLAASPYAHVWDYLYRLRKTQWQVRKLSSAATPYEIAKQRRALEISRGKLNEMHHTLQSLLHSQDGVAVFSYFLETHISASSKLFEVLPDNDYLPLEDSLKETKVLIISREYLLTMTSIRIRKLESPHLLFETELGWMKSLAERLKALGCRRSTYLKVSSVSDIIVS